MRALADNHYTLLIKQQSCQKSEIQAWRGFRSDIKSNIVRDYKNVLRIFKKGEYPLGSAIGPWVRRVKNPSLGSAKPVETGSAPDSLARCNGLFPAQRRGFIPPLASDAAR